MRNPNKRVFILPHGESPLHQYLAEIDHNKKWSVTVQPYRKVRTIEQNAFLHAVPLKLICDHTGYDMDDMKQYLMGQAFGWTEYEMMGQKRKKPLKTTSQLNTEQMAWFIEWIEAWAAQELEILIPKPNEVI